MISFFGGILLIPLVEVLVAQEVNRVENVPSFAFQGTKLGVLRPKDDSTCRVAFNVRHHVLLSNVDQVVSADIECSQSKFEFLFIRVASSELD